MNKRVLSIALALLLVVSLLPVRASAATNTDEIRKQITSMYRKIKASAGVSSLNGLCGLMTSWQIYLLGIDETLFPRDGRDQYNAYCDQEVTSGGYQVRPYPASEYSLQEALTIITKNGTWDAYNILVGFQWTNTEAGSRCGHALFIHAIIDGMVYFMEGFDMSLGGRYFSAGQAIECSIADFCSYYSGWVVFEGVIYFGLDSYTKACQNYPANLYVQAVSSTTMTADIPGENREFQDPEVIRVIAPGEWLHITGIYETPDNYFYYQISESDTVGYIPAENADLQTFCYDDVQAENLKAPGLLYKGQAFYLQGTLCSEQNIIDTILVEVYAEGEDAPTFAFATEQDTHSYSLNNDAVNQTIAFRKLTEGSYEYQVSVVVENHYIKDGCLQTQLHTVPVWCSEFQIGGVTDGSRSVVFDACGGTVTMNQMIIDAGDASFPTAERAGYTFLGWYTEPEGGTYVTSETVTDTVYAHWGPRTDGFTGWDCVDGAWRYYDNGILQTGWLSSGGYNYYLQQDGTAAVDLTLVDEIASISAALTLLNSPAGE